MDKAKVSAVSASVSLERLLNIETGVLSALLSLLSENDTTQEELKCNAKVFFLGHAARLLMICHIKSCRGKTYGNNLKYNRKGKKKNH